MILNKMRIQYWLCHGALVSEKVHYFLSLAQLLPAPLVKFGNSLNLINAGKSTVYERPEKQAFQQGNYKSVELADFQKKYF